jgi:hypothetical protein
MVRGGTCSKMIAPRRDTSVRRKGVGRDVAAVELHALDHFELSLEALASSTVIIPSLPTFFIASAMNLPISESPFAEMSLPAQSPHSR